MLCAGNKKEKFRFNLRSKRLKNAQLHDEIMRSWGIGGSALNKLHLYFGGTDALLAITLEVRYSKSYFQMH